MTAYYLFFLVLSVGSHDRPFVCTHFLLNIDGTLPGMHLVHYAQDRAFSS